METFTRSRLMIRTVRLFLKFLEINSIAKIIALELNILQKQWKHDLFIKCFPTLIGFHLFGHL